MAFVSKVTGRYTDCLREAAIDYDGQVEAMDRVLRQAGARDLLVVGCGTGGHERRLTKRGYRCVGLDHDTGALKVAAAIAEEQNLSIEYIERNLYDLEVQACYDAVAAINLDLEEAEFPRFVSAMGRHLRPDGVLLLMAFLAPGDDVDMCSLPSAAMPEFYLETVGDQKWSVCRMTNCYYESRQAVVWKSVILIDDDSGFRMTFQDASIALVPPRQLESLLREAGYRAVEQIHLEKELVAPHGDGAIYVVRPILT